MSRDVSPSSAARFDAYSSNGSPAGGSPPLSPNPNRFSSRRRRAPSRSRRRHKKKAKNRKRRNPGLAKKLHFLTHLLKSLDTLVFAELSALYYMECSMFRFVLRAIVQYLYITPKPESFPFLMAANQSSVILIAVSNIICMLCHMFLSLPVGPDYYRGYLHGGLIIDFVGQKPPTYRLYYLLADFAILVVQCLMMTIHTERERLRLSLKTFRPLGVDATVQTQNAPTLEDLDAEERGIPRWLAGIPEADETEDIELRRLHPNGERNGDAGTSRTDQRTSRASSDAEPLMSPLADMLSSGNAIMGEYHVISSVRSAALNLEATAAHSLRTLSYEATLAAIRARRRGTRNGELSGATG